MPSTRESHYFAQLSRRALLSLTSMILNEPSGSCTLKNAPKARLARQKSALWPFSFELRDSNSLIHVFRLAATGIYLLPCSSEPDDNSEATRGFIGRVGVPNPKGRTMKLSVIFKQFAILAILASLVILAACGGSSSTATPTTVTGNWSVTLLDSNNVAAYVFTTTLNQQIASPTTTSPITGSNLKVTTTNNACFNAASDAQQTGVFTVNAVFNGLTTNTVQLSVAGSPGTVSMNGTFTTNAVSGPWTLTNATAPSTCAMSGTFLMTRS